MVLESVVGIYRTQLPILLLFLLLSLLLPAVRLADLPDNPLVNVRGTPDHAIHEAIFSPLACFLGTMNQPFPLHLFL